VVLLLRKPQCQVKTIQMAFVIITNMKMLCPLNFFLKFKTVDADLAGPRLICGHGSHVDEQKASLMLLAFLCLVNATLASVN